jgi:exosortase/archaeosortase family protein
VYKPVVGATTVVLGLKVSKLPYTGFGTVTYILIAIALLVTGLLLARLGQARSGTPTSPQWSRVGRWFAAIAVGAAGLSLLVFTGGWRGFETWTAAHSIRLVTNHTTTAVVNHGVVVVHHNSASATAFALTNQCTVAGILGALLMGGAPLLLVRRLSMARVSAAIGLAALVLVVANLVRITAIGVAILAWGHDGFAFSHTYLGSLLTFVGTCLAGVTFALVLLARRSPAAAGSDLPGGVACS